MYQDDYKRWMEADLEDADLKPELARIEEMTRRSRSVLQLRLSLELQDFEVFLEQVRTG